MNVTKFHRYMNKIVKEQKKVKQWFKCVVFGQYYTTYKI